MIIAKYAYIAFHGSGWALKCVFFGVICLFFAESWVL